ncbi:MAG: hypothetical protein R3C11_01040 [Planctomycetaceae bacterium]
MALQLAVSKEGYIVGTYYNTTTEASTPVEGKVDHDTQRCLETGPGGREPSSRK